MVWLVCFLVQIDPSVGLLPINSIVAGKVNYVEIRPCRKGVALIGLAAPLVGVIVLLINQRSQSIKNLKFSNSCSII